MAADSGRAAYALRLNVDYPEQLDRLRTAFRIIWLIPVLIVPAVVVGGGILIGGPLLMVLFRQKYPRWWFDWNVEMTRFSARIGASLALLTDDYPSTDEQQAVHLDIDYPDVERDLNRWLPLVKWLLAIPHYVVLTVLVLVALVLVGIAWFTILFTGRYPRGIFDFVVGVYRWQYRVQGYAFLLVTDRYPPFSLE